MDEPLVDWVSLAVVGLGLLGASLRRAEPGWGRLIASQLLLLCSVGLIVTRWVGSVTSLPDHQHDWQSGTLMVCCGLGILAAVELVFASSPRRRLSVFVVVCLSGTVALLVCEALFAAVISIGVGAVVVGLAFRMKDGAAPVEPRESVLIALACGAWLLLCLGTWNHVVDRESVRPSRSPRQSAWPRTTTLIDAWQRTDWLSYGNDAESVSRVEQINRHEHGLGLAFCVLLLVIAWAKRNPSTEGV